MVGICSASLADSLRGEEAAASGIGRNFRRGEPGQSGTAVAANGRSGVFAGGGIAAAGFRRLQVFRRAAD